MPKETDSSREKIISKINNKITVAKIEINEALGEMKPAWCFRRWWYPGLTPKRLELVNDAYGRFAKMLYKIMGLHPDANHHLNFISTDNGSNCSFYSTDTYMTKASNFTIQKIKDIKENKKPSHYRKIVTEYIKDLHQKLNSKEDCFKIDSFNEIEECLPEYLTLVRDVIIYYALDSRKNNEKLMQEDKENMNILLDLAVLIIDKYFVFMEESASSSSITREEDLDNSNDNEERCKKWLEKIIYPRKLMEIKEDLERENLEREEISNRELVMFSCLQEKERNSKNKIFIGGISRCIRDKKPISFSFDDTIAKLIIEFGWADKVMKLAAEDIINCEGMIKINEFVNSNNNNKNKVQSYGMKC